MTHNLLAIGRTKLMRFTGDEISSARAYFDGAFCLSLKGLIDGGMDGTVSPSLETTLNQRLSGADEKMRMSKV